MVRGPLLTEDRPSDVLDFPGTGDDEVSFRRGEIIVVIAKDDGFGDGWWTVISPSQSLPPFVISTPCPVFHVRLDRLHKESYGHQESKHGQILLNVKHAAVSSTLKRLNIKHLGDVHDVHIASGMRKSYVPLILAHIPALCFMSMTFSRTSSRLFYLFALFDIRLLS
jgi:hypothetical protein